MKYFILEPPPPTEIDVSVVNGTSLLITWVPSPPVDGAGDVLFYHVRYSTNAADPVRWKEITVNSKWTDFIYKIYLCFNRIYFQVPIPACTWLAWTRRRYILSPCRQRTKLDEVRNLLRRLHISDRLRMAMLRSLRLPPSFSKRRTRRESSLECALPSFAEQYAQLW